MVGLQLITAFLPSPFPWPQAIMSRTLYVNRTGLMNNSNIAITAWVSKDKFLLRRIDINSSLTITPQILNTSSGNVPQSYTIKSALNESTVYNSFGAPVMIQLPPEAQNASVGLVPVDWRWAVFGSVRP